MGLIRAGNTVAGTWPWLLLAWLAVLAVRTWRRVEAGRDLHFVGLPRGCCRRAWPSNPRAARCAAPPADAVAPAAHPKAPSRCGSPRRTH